MQLQSTNIKGITMVMFSLTFVRHGETLYNRKNIIQGQTDVPLSSVGEQQAQLVANRLQNDRFTHIFSSDLSRAFNTAKIISDANKVCRCDITIDKRLRERKFGDAEGKSTKELLIAAKKAKKRYRDYTPPGAETVLQVQERVESFFADLCKMCTAPPANDCIMYTPAKIKRRHGGSLGRNAHHSKLLQISGRSQSFCGSGNVENIINDIKFDSEIYKDENDLNETLNFCNHKNLLTMQNGEGLDLSGKVIEPYEYRECFSSNSDESITRCDLWSVCNSSSKSNRSGIDSLSHSESNESSSSSSMVHGEYQSDSTISDSTISDVSLKSNQFEILTDVATEIPVCNTPITVNVYSGSWGTNMQHFICPNVSLSSNSNPFSSISSISSGRNNSFDDLEGLPTMLADILVVSHGGYIKETMKYFIDKLGCKMPGLKGALNVCPNCSISRFTITLDENTGQPSLICVSVHDKDHLTGLDAPEAKGAF